ncbi:MAG: hypothetical protein FD138_1824 [Planctomycetota bacterium]|nr:MAG: hypothetical protein FD138_1824 [Planctomycetota bacterium]
MLTIQGTSQRVCNGFTRRDVIRAAGTGLLGTSLPKLLARNVRHEANGS